VLLLGALRSRPLQMLYQEPMALHALQGKMACEQVRVIELENIQGRIVLTGRRNAAVSAWIDRVRLGAAVTPAMFGLAAALAARVA
jgi:hypothetical protein